MNKRDKAGLLIAAIGAAAGAAGTGAEEAIPAAAKPEPVGQSAQAGSRAKLSVSASAEGWVPYDQASRVSFALGGTAQLSYAPLPFLEALTRAGAQSIVLDSGQSVLYVGGAAGLGFAARLLERLSVGGSAWAGLGKVPYEGETPGLYELGARLEAGFRLSAAMSLGVSAGWERLANPYTGTFLDAISGGLRLKLAPAELRRDRVNLSFRKIETQAIFPVFRAWYDAEPLGAVTIRNDEDGPIENVRVSFFAPEYMGGPRICQTIPRVERGAAVTVPLYAVFDERILTLTENRTTDASIEVDYSFLGSPRGSAERLSLSLHHRNAMSWEDDRRAAAFVSPTDPAALWFSRYASSVVRDRMRGELPANLQFALGIFESLKLYGLNYVIDPNSAYVEMSENSAVVDYLQYPSQTLMYRGGDCDDLSILYCSLLEASGIPTAFITIPGHIYMAFELGMSEAEARDKFFDPGLLLFKDGRAWAPIEITMVKEGFVKAWRVGAKQWIDNDRVGSAAFYPMRENWKRYKPSGLQDAQARFALPDEAKAMAAFDSGVDRFIARELEPVLQEYDRKLAAKREPETLNEYGMAMAKVGMLDPAWERFSESAKAGYAWAWNNLANVAFVRKDYKLAYSYYQWTTTLLPGDPVAVLGMARCAYELDRYSESAILYEGLKAEAPALAARFGYLASAYGGSGRAWSMADRLSSSVWSKPGLSFDLPAAAAPSIAAAPPAPPTIQAPAAAIAPAAAPAAPALAKAESAVAPPSPVESAKAEPAAPIPAAPEAPTATIAAEPEAAIAAASAEPESARADEPAQAEPGPAVPAPAAIAAAPPPEEPSAKAAEPALPAVAAIPAPQPEPVAASAAPAQPAATTKPAITSTASALAAIGAANADQPKAVLPPSVVEKPPEDAEIAAKAAEALSVAPPAVEPPAVPPMPQASAPPVQAQPAQAVVLPSQERAKPAEQARAPEAPVAAPAVVPAPAAIQAPAASPAVSPATTAAASQVEAPVAAPAAIQAPAASPAVSPAPVAAPAAPAAPSAAISASAEPTRQAEAPAAVPAPVAAPIVVPVPTPAATAAVEKPAEAAKAAIAAPPADMPQGSAKSASSIAASPKPVSSKTAAVAPASRFESTAEPGGAPAFGKRLPEGANAEGYKPIQVQAPQAPAKAEAARASIDLSSAVARPTSGSWSRNGAKAAMTDPKAMFAKLAVATPGMSGPVSYEFSARSTGTGWVGFGLHLHGRGAWKLSGYGGGDSILVWVTCDPKSFGDSEPRLQVYRSRGEVDMKSLASVRLTASAFKSGRYRIDYDPFAGTLAVAVDGTRVLTLSDLKGPSGFDYVALRALDLAEFSDLTINPTRAGTSGTEPTR